MEFNKLISSFEYSLKQEREWNEQSERRIQELEWKNMGLQTLVTRLENIIEDEHPEIQRLIEVLKSKENRLRDINKELSKKDDEIARLKEEITKSEKFTTEHIGFLMVALRREPVRVIIEEKTIAQNCKPGVKNG